MTIDLTGKNLLQIVAAISVFVDGIIPFFVRPDHLSSLFWKTTIILVTGVGIGALIWQAMLQSREERLRGENDKLRQEREIHSGRLLEALAAKFLVTATPTTPTAALKEPTESKMLSFQDPRIYVYLGAADQMGFAKTEFILRNQGGDVAHRVQIEPLKLLSGEATFPRVETIAVDEALTVLPEIERFGALQRHDLTHLLMKEWDAAGELVADFARPMRIVYEDYRNNKLQTAFDLVYLPINEIMRRNHPSLLPSNERHVFEIRNLEISKIVS